MKEDYPEKCAQCGGPLEGPPDESEDKERWEEHDRLFKGMDRKNAVVICDDCFKEVCPGGKPDPGVLFEAKMDEEEKE